MGKNAIRKWNQTVEILVKVKGLTPEEFEKGNKKLQKRKAQT